MNYYEKYLKFKKDLEFEDDYKEIIKLHSCDQLNHTEFDIVFQYFLNSEENDIITLYDVVLNDFPQEITTDIIQRFVSNRTTFLSKYLEEVIKFISSNWESDTIKIEVELIKNTLSQLVNSNYIDLKYHYLFAFFVKLDKWNEIISFLIEQTKLENIQDSLLIGLSLVDPNEMSFFIANFLLKIISNNCFDIFKLETGSLEQICTIIFNLKYDIFDDPKLVDFWKIKQEEKRLITDNLSIKF